MSCATNCWRSLSECVGGTMSMVRRQKQIGLTLVELLVSITLGLVILIAIGTAYVNSSNILRQREDQSELVDPARVVLQMLRQNLSQAGYVDVFDVNAAGQAQAAPLFSPTDRALANSYARDTSEVATLGAIVAPFTRSYPGILPLFGCDGEMTSSPSAVLTGTAAACGTANATRHTLQVAYQAVALTPANQTNSLGAADLNTGVGLDCLQQPPPAGRSIVINRFSAPQPAAGAVSQFVCAGSAQLAGADIAAGVEEFVLRYQLSGAGSLANRRSAGGAQSQYVSAADVAASATGWPGVTAVEVCLVSATPNTRGAAAQGTVPLQPTRPTCTRDANGQFNADVARAAGDTRLWRRFTSVISVRNAVFVTPVLNNP